MFTIPTYIAQDSYQYNIVLHIQTVMGTDPRINEIIRSASDVLVSSYKKTELHFAKSNPELIGTDFMLKKLQPLFANGSCHVDWKLIENEIEIILRSFFENTNWHLYGKSGDQHVFITAFDQLSGQKLGFIQFFSQADFEPDTIKAALFGVLPSAQERCIEKLLMSSIFKYYPNLKRIFLHTRSTNQREIMLYQSWGFEYFEGKLPNWTDLQYLADQSNELQKVVMVKQ